MNRQHGIRFAVVGILVVGGLGEAGRAQEVSSVPLRAPSRVAGPELLTTLTPEESGIVFQNTLRSENMRKYLTNGAGVTVGDYDNDGLPDLYLVSQDGDDALFRQTEAWRFEDVTLGAGVRSHGTWGAGASFADIDDDGDLDLYVCNIDAPNRLFINQGDGTFDEQAEARGVAYPGASTMGAFADFDNDGDLDLYLLNNRVLTTAEEAPDLQVRMVNGEPTVHPDFRDQYFVLDGHLCEAGQRDILYANNGDGTFSDVTDRAGIGGYDTGLSATWWDYNNDGFLDLYVANDLMSPDRLYRNEKDGRFTEVIRRTLPHTPWFAMGADYADLNEDGVFDLLVADMANTTHYKQKVLMGDMGRSAWFLTAARPPQYMRNALYLSTGYNWFMEASYLAGLASTDWTWSVRFADIDLDGREDALCTNGVARNLNHSDWATKFNALLKAGEREEAEGLLEQIPALEEHNLAFRNMGDLRFEDVSSSWGFHHFGVSHGMVLADLDRDGDLDAIVNHMNEPVGVYRNSAADRGSHAVLIRLVGTQSNRDGVGAEVILEAGGRTQRRQIVLARGYMSGGESLVHFGLGAETTMIDSLRIEWPSGVKQELKGLRSDRLHTITETPTAGLEPPEFDDRTWFEVHLPGGKPLPFRHREAPYDDFARQPLLPNKLSQLGPGMAWGDADGDGDEDLFVGGAAGQSGALLINDDGAFKAVPGGAWEQHKASEDMGILWLDADADHDLDLCVISGGSEFDPGDPGLIDRLYVNRGAGVFEYDEGALGRDSESGGPVVGADYDGDGDLDLFIGGRQVPGSWPLTPRSRLLRNEGGRFTDVTAREAPELERPGMVTGAVWSDVDRDGRSDLLLTLEWGPIRVFMNTPDGFVDQTERAGLADHLGWWNGIAGGDFDHDGDIDFVATNFGLNTKYHASAQEPARLYCGDMDENGSLDLVEAEYEDGTLFPVRGRSCSSGAMPFVAEKFPTYDLFGRADLEEIYEFDRLGSAQRFEARRLESSVLINDGSGRFELRALPRIMQVSPGFGVVVEDFDADGALDVYIVQNFFSPQQETGRMDGGVSVLARGLGDGSFEPVHPRQSGLLLPADGTALTVCDLDDDGRPDVVAAVNDGALWSYRNTGMDNRVLTVWLEGGGGNPNAVGARVTVSPDSGAAQVREVYAGSGYLSQSWRGLRFGLGSGDEAGRVTVRWPDGTTTEAAFTYAQSELTLTQP